MSKNVQYASNRIQKNLRERDWITGNTVNFFKKINMDEVEGVLDVLIESNDDLEIKKNLSVLRANTNTFTDRKIMLVVICTVLKKQINKNLCELFDSWGYY